MMPGFTPGPWGLWSTEGKRNGRYLHSVCRNDEGPSPDGHLPVSVAETGHVCIAEARGATEQEALANARLIAAAPEMYEALQTIIDWADLALRNPDEFNSHGVRNLDGPAFDDARKVLAKATRAAATPTKEI